MTKTPPQSNLPPPADTAQDSHVKPAAASHTHAKDAGSSYANYLFGAAGSTDHPAWSDTSKGRAVIRIISRGIVGTAFFTIGGRLARTQLRNYHPEKELGPGAPPLQWLARGIDNTLGQVVKRVGWSIADTRKAFAAGERELMTAEQIAARKLEWRRISALEAVDFRPKAYYHDQPGLLHTYTYKNGMKITRPYNGRSYGAEVVGVTFDFAMASIGDATARNVIQAFDPNIKHSWMEDKDGNPTTAREGHFNAMKWLGALGRSSWRIMSKNQGEDWATGLVYVFQMKHQRQMLNKWFKGSKLVFDNHWNGGAYKVDDQGRIIGDYQLPGAIDLHLRFVGYNWYTLMFREGYDAIADHLNQWKKGATNLLPQLPHDPITATANTVASTVRYVLKSFIKANLYMQPAVIPFWLFRTPQSKWRGAYINNHLPGDVNAVASLNPDAKGHLVIHEPRSNNYDFNYSTVADKYPTAPGNNLRTGHEPNVFYFGQQAVHNPEAIAQAPFSAASYRHFATDGIQSKIEKRFSQAINPFGWASYKMGSLATRLSAHINPQSRIGRLIGWDTSAPGSSYANPTALGREHFVRSFVDASMAYTPYMWAKAETALRVDEHAPNQLGRMDKAIYSLIDNTVALNPRGMIAAGRDVINLALHFDKNVKSRETVEKPASTVSAASIQATPYAPATSKNASNDNAHNDNDVPDRSWAESVAGRHLGANFQTPSATRH